MPTLLLANHDGLCDGRKEKRKMSGEKEEMG